MQLEVPGSREAHPVMEADDIRRRLAASGQVFAGGESAGRIHDFEVEIRRCIAEGDSRRGAGLDIAYGFHPSPFGEALLMVADKAICALAFVDEGFADGRRAAVDDIMGRWPLARFSEAPGETASCAARVFGAPDADFQEPVPIVLIGTLFDIRVWQALLRIPMGCLVSYTDIACHLGRPTAARAVGTANGRNPISFVVPCHRALRSDGTLGGYYWGLDRKRAMIAWESRQVQPTP